MTPRLQNRRRHTRITLTGLTATVLQGMNRMLDGHLLDISLGGARISIDGERRDFGDMVEVRVGDIRAVGDVVWQIPGEIGIRFRGEPCGASAAVFEHVILAEYHRHAPGRGLGAQPLSAGC